MGVCCIKTNTTLIKNNHSHVWSEGTFVVIPLGFSQLRISTGLGRIGPVSPGVDKIEFFSAEDEMVSIRLPS